MPNRLRKPAGILSGGGAAARTGTPDRSPGVARWRPDPHNSGVPASDEDLLAAMAAGDPAAAAAFVRRHQGRVYGLAVTIVGSGGLAEEVAQDAFVRCWRYGGAYDGRRGSVVSWMLAITRNAAIDALRSRTDQPIDPERL